MPVRKWLQARRTRAFLTVLGWSVAIAVNFWTTAHPWLAFLTVVVSFAWGIFLFWPEIKKLRLVYPKGAHVESPLWLYLFAVAACGLLLVATARLYVLVSNGPTTLTSTELASSYLVDKHFHLADVADQYGVVRGRTFENCWVYGPSVVGLRGGNYGAVVIESSSFSGSRQGEILVQYDKPLLGPGIIALSDCTFKRCHFFDISIMAPTAVLNAIKSDNYGPGTDHPNELPPSTVK